MGSNPIGSVVCFVSDFKNLVRRQNYAISMDYVKIKIHNMNLDVRKKSFPEDKNVPKEEKKDVLEFLRLASL